MLKGYFKINSRELNHYGNIEAYNGIHTIINRKQV